MLKFSYYRSSSEPCEKGEISSVRVEFDYKKDGVIHKEVLRYVVNGYSLYRVLPKTDPSVSTSLGYLLNDKFILSGADDYRRKLLSRAVIHDRYFQERVFTVENIQRLSEPELSRIYNGLLTSEYYIIGDILRKVNQAIK